MPQVGGKCEDLSLLDNAFVVAIMRSQRQAGILTELNQHELTTKDKLKAAIGAGKVGRPL